MSGCCEHGSDWIFIFHKCEGDVFSVQVMVAYRGRGGIAALTLNVDTRYRLAFGLTPQPLPIEWKVGLDVLERINFYQLKDCQLHTKDSSP